ncbi:MAG: helix-turn-helix domain-containing protein [Sandaracinaceae bacterium]|nr:helix-turn-helix domain-containing protein [Sandaracinaceae bacterium]
MSADAAARIAAALERIADRLDRDAQPRASPSLTPSVLDRTAAARALRGLPRSLLSANEAAAYLGLSKSSFDRHVAKKIARVPVNASVRYERKDVDAWLESQKVGPSNKTNEAAYGFAGSGKVVVAVIDPREREMRQRLRSGRARSTKKSSSGSEPSTDE